MAATTTTTTTTSPTTMTDGISKHHDILPLSNHQTHTQTQEEFSSHDGLKFWQFMVAGSIASCAEHMAMFPVDTIKTRMQALVSYPIKFVGVRTAFRHGIAAVGLGTGPAHAVYFSVYELCKKALSNGNPNNHLAHAASGVYATVMSDAVLTPMDMVKKRLQLGGGVGGAYTRVSQCVKRVFKDEGFKAFYASYRTTVLMNAPFTAVYCATYEDAKKALVEISPNHVDGNNLNEETLLVHATAGTGAGALAAFFTMPLDVVKTQFQCQCLGDCLGCNKRRHSTLGCLKIQGGSSNIYSSRSIFRRSPKLASAHISFI